MNDQDWKTLKKYVKGIEMDGGREDVLYPSTEDEQATIKMTAGAILHEMDRMDGCANVCVCCGQRIKESK